MQKLLLRLIALFILTIFFSTFTISPSFAAIKGTPAAHAPSDYKENSSTDLFT